ncbi:MAG: 50S ribosomal protein L34e [archaeon]
MVKRSERYKKKKFRRTPGGKTVERREEKKSGKHHCAVCRKQLHGVPHGKKPSEVRRLSKTERRPTALFAGVLCNQCRTNAMEEAAKVNQKIKKLTEVELILRNYVEVIEKGL